MSDRIRFMASPNPLYEGFGVKVWGRLDGGAVIRPLLIEAETVNEGVQYDPMLRLGPDEAQSLMDALWSANVRPSTGEGSTGQIAAIERHLEDMRSLVFKRAR